MKVHITENALKDISLGERPNLKVYDNEVSGFGVQLSKGGTSSYFISYRDQGGRQHQQKIGRVGELAAHQAREQARRLLDDVRTRAAQTVRASARHGKTCSQFFFERYLPAVQASGSKAETHASLWRNHLESEIGTLRLHQVTQAHIKALKERLLAKPVAGGRWKTKQGKTLSSKTVNRILILVRHMFNIALRDEIAGVHKNPTEGFNLSTNPNEVKGTLLSAEDLRRLLDAAAQKDPDMVDILALAALTGLRRSNVLKMPWEWVNLQRGVLYIPSEATKGKQPIAKPMSDPVRQLLQRRWEVARAAIQENPQERWRLDWVFPNPATGKPFHSRYSAWDTVRKNAGMPNIRLHDLRHTFATMMLDAGCDIVDVKEALGHTQLKTTMKYLHITEQRKLAAEQRTAAFMSLAT